MNNSLFYYWECNFHITRHVRLLTALSLCHNILKGRGVTLPCSCRRTSLDLFD